MQRFAISEKGSEIPIPSSSTATPSSKAITGGSFVADRGPLLTLIAGNKPMVTPHEVTLDLLFFRRIFSNLYRRHGDSNGEVPVSVFQRSVVRLFRQLGMMKEEAEFDCQEYDTDGSGAVGWYEFVTCWRKSQVCVRLSWSERIYLAMEDPSTCFVGRMVNIVVTSLIFVSCVNFIIGTLPHFRTQPCPRCEPETLEIFDSFEQVCIIVFTMEYLLRLCTAPISRGEFLDYEQILQYVTEHEAPRRSSPIARLVTFVAQPMNIIDLFVIVPYYLEIAVSGLGVSSNFAVLRVLRLTRLFRLIKLGKSFEVFEIIIRVFQRSIKMFQILGVYLVLGMCFSSAAMYFVEGGTWDAELQEYIRTSHDGDESISPFGSVPHAFWWCVVTFTTVGYGEVVPVTVLGKVVAACTMLIGILVLAMPISVISMNFSGVWNEWNEERRLNAETMEQDLLSVSEALEGLQSRTKLVIEVYDDRAGKEKGEFLGEVKWTDLPTDSPTVKMQEDQIWPLTTSNEKKRSSDRMQGNLSAGFTWRPLQRPTESGDKAHRMIQGSLEVRVNFAEGLPRSDWKKAGQRDVYAVIHCWPKPPANMERGGVVSTKYQTRTVQGSLDPVWEEITSFEFCWPLDWKPEDESTPVMSFGNPVASTSSKDGRSASKSVLKCTPRCTPRQNMVEGIGDDSVRRVVEAQGREIDLLRQQVSEIHFMLRGLSSHLGVPAPAQGWRADGGRGPPNQGMLAVQLGTGSDSVASWAGLAADETDEGRQRARSSAASLEDMAESQDGLRGAARSHEPLDSLEDTEALLRDLGAPVSSSLVDGTSRRASQALDEGVGLLHGEGFTKRPHLPGVPAAGDPA